MHARAHLIVLLLFALAAAAPLAWSEDRPQSGVAGETPPSIEYGASRSSSTWIEKPDGTRVAVGRGVAWKGVKVYLSLLWDLVGVDAATGKTLYAVDVGAFWNALGFEEVTPRGGTKTWAVVLRPGARARAGRDKRQYHDLRTGRKLDVPGREAAPSGKPVEVRAAWKGRTSRIAKPFHALVGTAANWQALRERMFGDAHTPAFGRVDFAKEVVLVVSSGDGWNCHGISVEAAYEDAERILVRTRRHTFQTMGGGEKVRPYGVMVLPRRGAKAYVVERNRQGLIGGPPLWQEAWRAARLPRPEAALKGLPPAGAAAHAGWEGR